MVWLGKSGHKQFKSEEGGKTDLMSGERGGMIRVIISSRIGQEGLMVISKKVDSPGGEGGE